MIKARIVMPIFVALVCVVGGVALKVSGSPGSNVPGGTAYSPPTGTPCKDSLTDHVEAEFWTVNGAKGCDSSQIIYLKGGPGGAMSSYDTDDLGKKIFGPIAVNFYQAPGSGNSTRLPRVDYTIDSSLRFLDEFVEKKGQSPVVLVGDSWGAILAARYAAVYPNKVRAILLLAPGPLSFQTRSDNSCPNPLSHSDCFLKLGDGGGYRKDGSFMKFSPTTWFVEKKKVELGVADNIFTRKDVVPPNESDDETKTNNVANLFLNISNFETPVKVAEGANKIPAILLRGQNDQITDKMISGYKILFPALKVKILPKQGHVLDWGSCKGVIPISEALDELGVRPQPKNVSCIDYFTPLPNFKDAYVNNWQWKQKQ